MPRPLRTVLALVLLVALPVLTACKGEEQPQVSSTVVTKELAELTNAVTPFAEYLVKDLSSAVIPTDAATELPTRLDELTAGVDAWVSVSGRWRLDDDADGVRSSTTLDAYNTALESWVSASAAAVEVLEPCVGHMARQDCFDEAESDAWAGWVAALDEVNDAEAAFALGSEGSRWLSPGD